MLLKNSLRFPLGLYISSPFPLVAIPRNLFIKQIIITTYKQMSKKNTGVVVRANNSVDTIPMKAPDDSYFYINGTTDDHSTIKIRHSGVKGLMMDCNSFNDEGNGEFDSDNLWPTNFIASIISGRRIYGNAVFFIPGGNFNASMLEQVLVRKGFPNPKHSGEIRFPENKPQFKSKREQ